MKQMKTMLRKSLLCHQHHIDVRQTTLPPPLDVDQVLHLLNISVDCHQREKVRPQLNQRRKNKQNW